MIRSFSDLPLMFYLLTDVIIIMTHAMTAFSGHHGLLLFDRRIHCRLRRGPQECLGHDARVVVCNFPLVIFPHVYKRISALDLVTRGAHGEFWQDDGMRDGEWK